MAEVKNSFLASKMNQDLDDRLIPAGEYRDALNISIGKSENSDVGTLQNIMGNDVVGIKNEEGLECIGYYMDNVNNRIFQFLVHNTTEELPDPIYRISVYDFNAATDTILVEGLFLNFSSSYSITGITLLENLLFWTDYNNQPRKINVQSALAFPANSITPYYTREEQISVAKYAPVDPISLVKTVKTIADGDWSDSFTIDVLDSTGIEPGMTMIGINSGIQSNDFVIVESVSFNTIILSNRVTIFGGELITFLISTMSDRSNEPSWPGDPAYLKSRYVRFSYRFRLDDGEYTLMAPFTQIAFIPNQKGYFIEGNETDAYTSTVVNWFENNINNIQLLVPFPDILANVNQSYKIQALDILYKEADSLEVKVIETILYNQFANNTINNIFTYNYQSRKPYKVLPTDQTTRVYDMVPVKALAQETASNRIVYGNFLKNHTAPKSLNYQVSITQKQDYYTSFIEYPNHTVKQNRTYQTGFVLSDKYGRQSSVILSSLDTITTEKAAIVYGGSTIFSPYYSDSTKPVTRDWFGNAISILLNSPITSSINASTGEPGLYAEQESLTGFTLRNNTIITNTTYELEISAGVMPNILSFLRGEYTDYVQITDIQPPPLEVDPYDTTFVITTNGRINNLYERDFANDPADIKYSYTLNPLGWYSYKIVVRQQEQDYYNVYLPGMLNGYPKGQTYGSQILYTDASPKTENGINVTKFPTSETGMTAHIVLINDNINKVPRDLVEVGPDQKLYRSSVQLFGRVENTIVTSGVDHYPNNKQYFPSKKSDTAIAIATSTDLSFLPNTVDNLKGSAAYNFYQLETHPLIARIATTNSIGVVAYENVLVSTNPDVYGADPLNMLPCLSVYETKPESSLLDIFWETSTTGLISDLNWDVLTGYDGAVGFSDINWGGFIETADPLDSTKYITTEFWPISNTGVFINSSNVSMTVLNGHNVPCDASFGIEIIDTGGDLTYRIYIVNNFSFINDILSTKFTFKISFIPEGLTTSLTFQINGRLENAAPLIVKPTTARYKVFLNSPAPSLIIPIYICEAVNGANYTPLKKDDLKWRIAEEEGYDPPEYCNIITNPVTKNGEVYLVNEFTTGDTLQFKIYVEDAMSPSGIPVTNIDSRYASKQDFFVPVSYTHLTLPTKRIV